MKKLGRAGTNAATAQALRRFRCSAPAETTAPKPLWNSLEIARIAVGILTPISIAILGIIVSLTTNSENRAFQETQFNQALARESAVRTEARKEARLDRIYGRRHEIWRELGAKAERLRSSSTSLLWLGGQIFDEKVRELLALHRSLVLEIRAASAYFSPEFVESLSDWAESIRQIISVASEPSDVEGSKLVEAEGKYRSFLVHARRNLRMED